MTTTMYGISNCDTIRKARAWLGAAGIAYAFHDYRKDGIERAMLERWADALGWEALLNRSGTTFRALPEEERAGLDRDKAFGLMLAQPAMIKRPLLDVDGAYTLGFKAERYAAIFSR